MKDIQVENMLVGNLERILQFTEMEHSDFEHALLHFERIKYLAKEALDLRNKMVLGQ